MRGDPPGSPGVVDAMDEIWDKRLRRCDSLTPQWPFAAEILGFFRSITLFQREFARSPATSAIQEAIDRDDFQPFVPHLDRLIEHVCENGPAALIQKARQIAARSREERERLLFNFWLMPDEVDPTEEFFPKVLLQPQAMVVTSKRSTKQTDDLASGLCPSCGCPPVVSVLREDKLAEAVARSLVCSLCSLEWSFTRVLCPGCREEKPERLPRLAAAEIPWIRVEACDACGRYLKAVDLTKDPAADPVTDEIASTPLDVVAAERGYAKLQANIVGV